MLLFMFSAWAMAKSSEFPLALWFWMKALLVCCLLVKRGVELWLSDELWLKLLAIVGGETDANLGLEVGGDETTALDKRRFAKLDPEMGVLAESTTEDRVAAESFFVGDPEMVPEEKEEEEAKKGDEEELLFWEDGGKDLVGEDLGDIIVGEGIPLLPIPDASEVLSSFRSGSEIIFVFASIDVSLASIDVILASTDAILPVISIGVNLAEGEILAIFVAIFADF